jgi:hypothetical protein
VKFRRTYLPRRRQPSRPRLTTRWAPGGAGQIERYGGGAVASTRPSRASTDNLLIPRSRIALASMTSARAVAVWPQEAASSVRPSVPLTINRISDLGDE